jgi:hypothetical protein
MSKVERMAADVSRNSATFQRDTVATAEVCAIPAAWLGKFVDFSAVTKEVYIRFGTADTVSCDYTTASARDAGTKALTATTAGPHLIIAAGATVPERVDASYTHFAHISSATGGKLYAVLSTGDGE